MANRSSIEEPRLSREAARALGHLAEWVWASSNALNPVIESVERLRDRLSASGFALSDFGIRLLERYDVGEDGGRDLGCGSTPVCDYCEYYNFNGDEDGAYTGEGRCEHPAHPHDAEPGDLACEDFECELCRRDAEAERATPLVSARLARVAGVAAEALWQTADGIGHITRGLERMAGRTDRIARRVSASGHSLIDFVGRASGGRSDQPTFDLARLFDDLHAIDAKREALKAERSELDRQIVEVISNWGSRNVRV